MLWKWLDWEENKWKPVFKICDIIFKIIQYISLQINIMHMIYFSVISVLTYILQYL